MIPCADGVVELMETDVPGRVEDDYNWDYLSDRRITPFTEARWRLLAARTADAIRGAGRPVVVAVGGGGENRVAQALDGQVAEYAIVETSRDQLARARFPTAVRRLALRAPGEQLPFIDDSVDVVEMSGVLDHFVDPARAIAEAARTLIPGGLVTVSLTNDGSWYRVLARTVRVKSDDGHAHAHHFDTGAVARLLEPYFDGVSVETLGYVRAPAALERWLASLAPERWHERLVVWTDAAARMVLGHRRGGMMLVTARLRATS